MRGKYTKIWAQKQVTKLFKTKEGVQFCKIDNVCSAKLSDQSSPKTQFMLIKLQYARREGSMNFVMRDARNCG